MAQKRGIRVRISHQRVEALQELCDEMNDSFQPTNDHHLLLKEYMYELQHSLKKLTQKPQELYTIALSGTESIAFYQLWQMLDLKNDKYAAVIVESMLKKMSRLAA